MCRCAVVGASRRATRPSQGGRSDGKEKVVLAGAACAPWGRILWKAHEQRDEMGKYVSVPPPANFVFAWAWDGLVRFVLVRDYAYSAAIADFVSAEPF